MGGLWCGEVGVEWFCLWWWRGGAGVVWGVCLGLWCDWWCDGGVGVGFLGGLCCAGW